MVLRLARVLGLTAIACCFLESLVRPLASSFGPGCTTTVDDITPALL